jgi:CHASE2 domain-containing sensor protein
MEHNSDDTATAFIVLMAILNMLPFIIALVRRHNAKVGIFVTLLLVDIGMALSAVFALVGIGFISGFFLMLVWFGTLMWSFNSNTKGHDVRLAKLMANAIHEKK